MRRRGDTRKRSSNNSLIYFFGYLYLQFSRSITRMGLDEEGKRRSCSDIAAEHNMTTEGSITTQEQEHQGKMHYRPDVPFDSWMICSHLWILFVYIYFKMKDLVMVLVTFIAFQQYICRYIIPCTYCKKSSIEQRDIGSQVSFNCLLQRRFSVGLGVFLFHKKQGFSVPSPVRIHDGEKICNNYGNSVRMCFFIFCL